MKRYQLFLLFLILRISSVFIVKSMFVPDEYWQTLEVAHKMSFGYGHLTWEWTYGIRNYMYPAAIAGLFKILQYLGLDRVNFIVLVPRLFQAVLSAVGDLYFWRWCAEQQRRQQISNFGLWAAYSITTSWFWFYCASRTLSNTLETVFTIIGLYCYPWNFNRGHEGIQWHLIFAGLACIVRPTAVIYWAPLCLLYLFSVTNKVKVIIYQYLPISTLLVAASTLIDSYFYDRLIFTPWNFVKVNWYHNIGAFYGTQPFYWYLLAFPIVLGIHTLFFVLGAVNSFIGRDSEYKINRILCSVIAWTIFVYSLVPHKEFRFILPLIPMALFVSSTVVARWSRTASKVALWTVAIVLLITSVVPSVYFGMFHNTGTVDVVDSLAKVAHKHPTDTRILFLMPCHSTPLYSHIHADIPAKFLTCEPNFSGSEYYLDEAEIFYKNPDAWLNDHYPTNDSLPTHIVSYDTLFPALKDFLNKKGFRHIKKFYHTQYPDSPRVGEYVNLYLRKQ